MITKKRDKTKKMMMTMSMSMIMMIMMLSDLRALRGKLELLPVFRK